MTARNNDMDIDLNDHDIDVSGSTAAVFVGSPHRLTIRDTGKTSYKGYIRFRHTALVNGCVKTDTTALAGKIKLVSGIIKNLTYDEYDLYDMCGYYGGALEMCGGEIYATLPVHFLVPKRAEQEQRYGLFGGALFMADGEVGVYIDIQENGADGLDDMNLPVLRRFALYGDEGGAVEQIAFFVNVQSKHADPGYYCQSLESQHPNRVHRCDGGNYEPYLGTNYSGNNYNKSFYGPTFYAYYQLLPTRGDFDGDDFVTSDDAVFLLRHVLFPEDHPVVEFADYTGDDMITSDDAVYLLRHVLFPSDYPLPVSSQSVEDIGGPWWE